MSLSIAGLPPSNWPCQAGGTPTTPTNPYAVNNANLLRMCPTRACNFESCKAVACGGSPVRSGNCPDVHTGRIKPADLPITQPTKFKLVTNLEAGMVLGRTVLTTELANKHELHPNLGRCLDWRSGRAARECYLQLMRVPNRLHSSPDGLKVRINISRFVSDHSSFSLFCFPVICSSTTGVSPFGHKHATSDALLVNMSRTMSRQGPRNHWMSSSGPSPVSTILTAPEAALR